MRYNWRVQTETDLLIIGGGPAGISAAIWADDLGIDRLLIERGDSLGGQLKHTFNSITNYPGFKSIEASELQEKFASQIKLEHGIRFGSELVRVNPEANTAYLDNGEMIGFRAMIFAAGVRRRALGVPGESEFYDRGILNSGAQDPEKVKGETVVVIGGGDAAFENALILSQNAEKVYLVHRNEVFSARRHMIDAVRSENKIKVLTGFRVREFIGSDHLSSVVICRSEDPNEILELESGCAIVRIGVQPNSEPLAKLVETDGKGYIHVTREFRTSRANIFAAGDVALPTSPTLASAIGSASTAVKTASSLFKQLEIG